MSSEGFMGTRSKELWNFAVEDFSMTTRNWFNKSSTESSNYTPDYANSAITCLQILGCNASSAMTPCKKSSSDVFSSRLFRELISCRWLQKRVGAIFEISRGRFNTSLGYELHELAYANEDFGIQD